MLMLSNLLETGFNGVEWVKGKISGETGNSSSLRVRRVSSDDFQG